MTIDERIEKVEVELARAKRRNRLLLAVVLLSFVLLAAAMTAGITSREDAVNAKQFNLLDENDKTRATLAVEKGVPQLVLYDPNGMPRAGLALPKDGPGLVLFDVDGKASAGLRVSKDGPGLVLVDANGKARAVLGTYQTTTPDGKVITYPESSLILFSSDGKVRWQAPP